MYELKNFIKDSTANQIPSIKKTKNHGKEQHLHQK